MVDQARRRANGNPPISRHPLFPAIVALWFGALFGLASVAIKPALVEQAVTAASIDSILPMAAPPLGATAQGLIALFMTVLGGAVGMLVARRIARGQPDGHDRRALTDTESGVREVVPLLRTDRVPEEPAESRKPAPPSAILNVADFDLASFDEEETRASNGQAEAPTLAAPAPSGGEAVCSPLFETYSREATARSVTTGRISGEAGISTSESTNPFLEEPLSENPMALDREEGLQSRSAPAVPPSPGAWPDQDTSSSGAAAERIATAELDALSQVELLERLALAMARRRDEVACSAMAPAAFQEEPPLPPEEGDDRTQDLGGLSNVPTALRPVEFREPDEDDALPGYIPPRHIGGAFESMETGFAAAPSFDDETGEDEEEETETLDEGYSSLLDLSRPSPARRQFAQTFDADADDPAQTMGIGADDIRDYPNSRPFDPPGEQPGEGTEQALRAALAALQRMSGAA